MQYLYSIPSYQRTAQILRLRFDFDFDFGFDFDFEDDHPHTLRGIGDLARVTRERIRQLQKLGRAALRYTAATGQMEIGHELWSRTAIYDELHQ